MNFFYRKTTNNKQNKKKSECGYQIGDIISEEVCKVLKLFVEFFIMVVKLKTLYTYDFFSNFRVLTEAGISTKKNN